MERDLIVVFLMCPSCFRGGHLVGAETLSSDLMAHRVGSDGGVCVCVLLMISLMGYDIQRVEYFSD